MVNVNSKFQGELWFFTHDDDPKTGEIAAHPQVNVSFSSPGDECYVSLCGPAQIVKDPKRCELLWTPECRPWFTEGPADPKLALVHAEVEHAEYWDASRNAILSFPGILRGLAGKSWTGNVEHERLDWQAAEQ
jgi:general stress protein 26